jgi:hypothetical protein
MAVGSISVVAPIAAVGAVVSVVFGIATGDNVSRLQLLGLALALALRCRAWSFERHAGEVTRRRVAGDRNTERDCGDAGNLREQQDTMVGATRLSSPPSKSATSQPTLARSGGGGHG